MTRTWNQSVATAFGIVYLLLGLAGFAVTGFDAWLSRSGDSLLGFDVNPVHNVVHLAIGISLLGSARAGLNAARSANVAVGGTYLIVGILGLFLVGSEANILALNHADNGLHLASALILLVVGLMNETAPVARPTVAPREAASAPTAAPVSEADRTPPTPKVAQPGARGPHAEAADVWETSAPADAWTEVDTGHDWESAEVAADWESAEIDAEDATQAMSAEEIAGSWTEDGVEAEAEVDAEAAEAPPAPDRGHTVAEDIEAMSKEDLYRLAQELEIQGRSSMTKDELVDAVRDRRS